MPSSPPLFVQILRAAISGFSAQIYDFQVQSGNSQTALSARTKEQGKCQRKHTVESKQAAASQEFCSPVSSFRLQHSGYHAPTLRLRPSYG
jgi:hypothetical protein